MDVSRSLVEADPDDRVAPVHPLTTDAANLARWQDHILKSEIRQPFNQVFRETYQLAPADDEQESIEVFAGFIVDARTILGVARSAGWLLCDGVFHLPVADATFTFDVGGIFPGCTGTVSTGPFGARRQARAWCLRDVPPILMSEVLRSIDLLVSVASFALDPDNSAEFDLTSRPFTVVLNRNVRPRLGSVSARTRREVLRRLFGETEVDNKTWVDGRYLRVSDIAIHIATGQARRDGTPLDDPPSGNTIKLPYGDPVLERIVSYINVVR